MRVYSVECVLNITSILSINFHVIYGAMCNRLSHFPCDDCDNTVLSSL